MINRKVDLYKLPPFCRDGHIFPVEENTLNSICIWKNTYAIKYFFDNLVIIQEKLSCLNIMAFILLIDICPFSRMIYIIIVWPSVPGLVGASDL